MIQEQLAAILEAASARPDGEWSKLADGRTLTLYVAHDGVQLTVPRVEAITAGGQLVKARTAKQEIYIFALTDLFAASTESANAPTRKAGFL